MNSDWWKKIDETYRTARELTGDAQSRFLDTACMADLEMRRQVEMLLKEHEDRNTLLNRPTIEFTSITDHQQAVQHAGKFGVACCGTAGLHRDRAAHR